MFRQSVCFNRDREAEIISFVSSNCQSVMWYVFNLRLIAVWVIGGPERTLDDTHRAERVVSPN